MKKIYILILILSVGFIACRKDQQAKPVTAKGYPVNFNISGFSSVILPIKSNSGKLITNDVAQPALPFTYLFYMLMDANNKTIHTIKQGFLAPNIGHFNDTIPAGQYSVVIIGSNQQIQPIQVDGVIDTAFYQFGANKDLFFKKYPLNVTSSLPQQNIVLDRIVGQVELNIQDSIPGNLNSISLSFTDIDGFSITRNGLPVPGIRTLSKTTKNITAADVGTTNYTIDAFVGNTISPVDITVNAGNVTRIIRNVQFKVNTKTILTGKLFSGTASTFNVTYHTAYADTLKNGF